MRIGHPSSAIIEDTIIEGVTPGVASPEVDGLSPPTAAFCINLEGGNATLRNVTLSRCDHMATDVRMSGYVAIRADSLLVGSFVTLKPSCDSPRFPLIGAYANTATFPVALRRLRFLTDDGCSLPAVNQLVAPHTSIALCAQLSADTSCGDAATCSDVALPGMARTCRCRPQRRHRLPRERCAR